MDVQFFIKNLYPSVKNIISMRGSIGDINKIQRTHDLPIKVMGDGLISQLVHA